MDFQDGRRQPSWITEKAQQMSDCIMQIWKLEGLRNPKQSLSLQHVFLRGPNKKSRYSSWPQHTSLSWHFGHIEVSQRSYFAAPENNHFLNWKRYIIVRRNLIYTPQKTCCRDNDCFGFLRPSSFHICMMQSDICCAFSVIQDGVRQPYWKWAKS